LLRKPPIFSPKIGKNRRKLWSFITSTPEWAKVRHIRKNDLTKFATKVASMRRIWFVLLVNPTKVQNKDFTTFKRITWWFFNLLWIAFYEKFMCHTGAGGCKGSHDVHMYM
jgi:hypothetical protein